MPRYRPDVPDSVHKRASRIRGVFYALAGGIVVWIAVSLCLGALDGIENGNARDPFSGRPVAEFDGACVDWAQALSYRVEADGDLAELPTGWHLQTMSWRWACGHLDDTDVQALRRAAPRVYFSLPQ